MVLLGTVRDTRDEEQLWFKRYFRVCVTCQLQFDIKGKKIKIM